MTIASASERRLWRGLVIVLIFPISMALYTNRDPWIDEAMLANNLVEMSVRQIHHPMPLYEQAAPIGYILLAKLILLSSGIVDPTFALRALSAAISLIAVLILFRLAREEASTASALAVATVALTSPFFIRYATEIKQYIFDFLATATIAYAAARIARLGARRDFVVFLILSSLGCLFSFIAVIPIVSCLSAAAFRQICRTTQIWRNEAVGFQRGWRTR